PDHANLPQLVAEDLNHKHSRGFGSMKIHHRMLIDQLEACLKLKPELLNNGKFVQIYLSKLQPNDDVDWRRDAKVYEAYLDRQWNFVKRLSPVHNSLKASVLYHRLVFDRTQGVYDKDRFMAYIKLPRSVSYINPKYIRLPEHRNRIASLSANFQKFTHLPPIRSDEPLVRSYLHHYFIKETATKPYESYIEVNYLRRQMAETKLVHGLGDPEQWYAWLSPSYIKSLKERIDLDFAHTNKKWFGADEIVAVDLNVKNVKTLLIKVFRINERNYYRDKNQEVSTAINLDGLVANHRDTAVYKVPPVRRVERHFTFPQIKEPGTYVIDFIGNGRNSRVLVRKGRLRYLVRTSTAGQVFTVLDENNRRQPDAEILLGSHSYRADEEGRITAPFTSKPQSQAIVLMAGQRITLESFDHQAEKYHLGAGLYVDRESLLQRNKAKVIVRPSLSLNGTPVTLSVLEDVQLLIQSQDRDGVRSTQVVKDFKLFEDRESVHEFKVPARLHSISFALSAKVKSLSQNKKVDLSSSAVFAINGIDRTDKTEDLHFAAINGGYVIDLLGRTGEAKASRPIQVQIKHRDFKNSVHATLKTDRAGRVDLGALRGVQWVKATSPQGVSHTWKPESNDHSYPGALHGVAGQPLKLPYMHGANKALRSELSLLEVRGDNFVADRFEALSVEDGRITIGKLPRGDYDLLIKPLNQRIHVRLAEGAERDGFVLSDNRQLQTKDADPLQIVSVQVGPKTVDVQLGGAGKFARVHVFANRFDPAFSAFKHLGSVRDADPFVITVPHEPSAYMEGRDIGDEYRYILDRRYTKRYPGNLLKRPSLLLNPWAIRKTNTGHQVARKGQDAFGSASGRGSGKTGGFFGSGGHARPQPHFANLDFLATGSVVLTNLRPDEKGMIQIERKLISAHPSLHIVAVDPRQT
ncbi:MAG: hypothetical protein R3236_07515, partial [Phycisphaeraceae bacterium]|nr:hypothetical protein [Phycisphaeraceae bacterium]